MEFGTGHVVLDRVEAETSTGRPLDKCYWMPPPHPLLFESCDIVKFLREPTERSYMYFDCPKLNICISYNPAIPLPVIYTREISTYAHQKICTSVILALLAITENRKLPQYSSVFDDEMNKYIVVYLYN